MARPGEIRSGGGLSSLWKSDILPTLALGSPIAGAQLAQMAINTTDVVMVGWLGAQALAAMVLAFNLYILIWLFGMGVLQAVIPLAAKARGERNPRELRRAVRMGFWVVALYSIPALLVLWHTEAILLALGQEAEVARLQRPHLLLRPALVQVVEVGPGAVEDLLGAPRRPFAVEVMEFLDRRHPEFRMELDLVVEPAGATLLRADAQEVRANGRPRRAGHAPLPRIGSAAIHQKTSPQASR